MPSCLNLRSHAGPPPHPSGREITQTNNCSDRRALICYITERPLPEKADEAVGGGRWVCRLRSRRLGPVHSGLSPGSIQAGMCPRRQPAETHSQACQRPQPAQADVFWVLLFRFSGNCFPCGPAGGTRCQVVLWEGVMEGWEDRVYYQS